MSIPLATFVRDKHLLAEVEGFDEPVVEAHATDAHAYKIGKADKSNLVLSRSSPFY